jgi:two-component system response regulator NreC
LPACLPYQTLHLQKTLTILNFSSRELEVLSYISEGFTNQEIADKMFTSRRTIEGHRQSLMDKTGSRNSAVLIRFAVVNGVIN